MPRPCRPHQPAAKAKSRGRPALSLLVLLLVSCSSPSPEPPRADAVPDPAVIGYASQRGLVDVRAFLPDIVCDLRYATKENVTGQVLYPPDMPCLLSMGTAEKLAHAQDLLRPQGFGLKIWDAWRPPEVQTELYRYGLKTGKAALFVNPREAWSFHCSGTAVDITLVDSRGREMPLPTYFDEAGPRARSLTPVSDPRILRNIHALQEAMVQSGFTPIELEWWHFDDASFKGDATQLPVVFAQEIGVRLPRLK
jgi:zinc D-Ala-D-Ala dipeptidase